MWRAYLASAVFPTMIAPFTELLAHHGYTLTESYLDDRCSWCSVIMLATFAPTATLAPVSLLRVLRQMRSVQSVWSEPHAEPRWGGTDQCWRRHHHHQARRHHTVAGATLSSMAVRRWRCTGRHDVCASQPSPLLRCQLGCCRTECARRCQLAVEASPTAQCLLMWLRCLRAVQSRLVHITCGISLRYGAVPAWIDSRWGHRSAPLSCPVASSDSEWLVVSDSSLNCRSCQAPRCF